jgi:hypothetical protein
VFATSKPSEDRLARTRLPQTKEDAGCWRKLAFCSCGWGDFITLSSSVPADSARFPNLSFIPAVGAGWARQGRKKRPHCQHRQPQYNECLDHLRSAGGIRHSLVEILKDLDSSPLGRSFGTGYDKLSLGAFSQADGETLKPSGQETENTLLVNSRDAQQSSLSLSTL